MATPTLEDYRDFLLSRDDSNRHKGLCHLFADWAMEHGKGYYSAAVGDFLGDRFAVYGMYDVTPFHDSLRSFFRDRDNKRIVPDREAFVQSEIDWLNKVLEGTGLRGCTHRPVNE